MSLLEVFPHGETKCDREGHHLHFGPRGRNFLYSSGWHCNTCGWVPGRDDDEVFSLEQVRRLVSESR